MANYRGSFRGFDRVQSNNPNGDRYCVHIGEFSAETYTEVEMAGSQPFVMSYNTSETPFEPVRTSTATIQFVHNTYMEDILPSTAKQTKVWLYNETAARLEWCGYIVPRIYDNNYTECLETVQIEAADCISVLQYCDYSLLSGDTKSLVPLNKILGQICDATGQLDGFSWSRGKYLDGGLTEVTPTNVYLSEANFFSSDTDEPWKLSSVLEEICRYFGLTAMQFQNKIYLIDYLAYRGGARTNIPVLQFTKAASDYSTGVGTTLTTANYTINQSEVRSSSADISFEPVYNKCVVKANMYAAEDIIPSIFDDKMLTNRFSGDNFYQEIQLTVPEPTTPSYLKGAVFLGVGQKYHEDGSGDTRYSYFMRAFDHKYWKSVYLSNITTPSLYPKNQTELTAFQGATVVDLGVVRNLYISEYQQRMVASKLDYTRYLMINQQNIGSMGQNYDYPVYVLSGYTIACPYDPENSYLVIKGSAMFEKYTDRCYINPEWEKDSPQKGGGSQAQMKSDGCVNIRVKIGDKYWRHWRYGWVTDRAWIVPLVNEMTEDNRGSYNTERKVLNNVSYNLGIGEDGFLIPLSGTNVGDPITIEIHMPKIQYNLGGQNLWNGFCWVKDLDIKLVQKGQGTEQSNEGDMVYENVISDDAVNDLREITCRLTTAYSGVAPSYSNVLIKENSKLYPLSGFTCYGAVEAKEGENNIVERYVNQYSTPTKKITMTVESNGAGRRYPWTLYKGLDIDNPNSIFVELGSEIDYQAGTKTITAIDLK